MIAIETIDDTLLKTDWLCLKCWLCLGIRNGLSARVLACTSLRSCSKHCMPKDVFELTWDRKGGGGQIALPKRPLLHPLMLHHLHSSQCIHLCRLL